MQYILDMALYATIFGSVFYFAIGFILTAIQPRSIVTAQELSLEFAALVAELERTIDVRVVKPRRLPPARGFGKINASLALS